MKIYGLELGCTKLLTASKNFEIVKFYIFGGKDLKQVQFFLRGLKFQYEIEHISSELPLSSPNVEKVTNLADALSEYPNMTIHIKVPISYGIKKFVEQCFCPRNFIQLTNE